MLVPRAGCPDKLGQVEPARGRSPLGQVVDAGALVGDVDRLVGRGVRAQVGGERAVLAVPAVDGGEGRGAEVGRQRAAVGGGEPRRVAGREERGHRHDQQRDGDHREPLAGDLRGAVGALPERPHAQGDRDGERGQHLLVVVEEPIAAHRGAGERGQQPEPEQVPTARAGAPRVRKGISPPRCPEADRGQEQHRQVRDDERGALQEAAELAVGGNRGGGVPREPVERHRVEIDVGRGEQPVREGGHQAEREAQPHDHLRAQPGAPRGALHPPASQEPERGEHQHRDAGRLDQQGDRRQEPAAGQEPQARPAVERVVVRAQQQGEAAEERQEHEELGVGRVALEVRRRQDQGEERRRPQPGAAAPDPARDREDGQRAERGVGRGHRVDAADGAEPGRLDQAEDDDDPLRQGHRDVAVEGVAARPPIRRRRVAGHVVVEREAQVGQPEQPPADRERRDAERPGPAATPQAAQPGRQRRRRPGRRAPRYRLWLLRECPARLHRCSSIARLTSRPSHWCSRFALA